KEGEEADRRKQEDAPFAALEERQPPEWRSGLRRLARRGLTRGFQLFGNHRLPWPGKLQVRRHKWREVWSLAPTGRKAGSAQVGRKRGNTHAPGVFWRAVRFSGRG